MHPVGHRPRRAVLRSRPSRRTRRPGRRSWSGKRSRRAPPSGSMVSTGRPGSATPVAVAEAGAADDGAQGGGRTRDGRCLGSASASEVSARAGSRGRARGTRPIRSSRVPMSPPPPRTSSWSGTRSRPSLVGRATRSGPLSRFRSEPRWTGWGSQRPVTVDRSVTGVVHYRTELRRGACHRRLSGIGAGGAGVGGVGGQEGTGAQLDDRRPVGPVAGTGVVRSVHDHAGGSGGTGDRRQDRLGDRPGGRGREVDGWIRPRRPVPRHGHPGSGGQRGGPAAGAAARGDAERTGDARDRGEPASGGRVVRV